MPDQTSSISPNPLTAKPNTTIAYTDGACKGNPGAGGWGAHLIFSDGSTQDLYGGEDNTTNNRMELMGAINALAHAPSDQKLEIWTDSSYVKNGITNWIAGWKKKGWKTANKKPVANQDLWQVLDAHRQNRQVDWHWVKGHAGHVGNEKADALANLGVTGSHMEATAIDAAPNNMVVKDSTAKTSTTKKKASSDADDWIATDPLGLDWDDADTMTGTTDDTDPIEPEAITGYVQDAAMQAAEPNYPSRTSHPRSHIVRQDMTHSDPTHPNTQENTVASTQQPYKANAPKEVAPLFNGDTSTANPHFRPLLPEPIHRHDTDRQLIMDTETTGLDPLNGDRIIEVGIVELVGRRFTGEKLHVYINPQRGMDEEVIRIHGISEAFLQDKPTFDQVAQQLYDFMDGAEIIAHNASFDMNFLTMEFNKVGLADFAERVQVTDSLLMAKQLYPGQKNTLDALVRRLNVGKQDRTFHGALLDSEILAEVYLAMTGGQVTLAIEEDVTSDGGQTAHANFAHLAHLLVASSGDQKAEQAWYTALADEYPKLQTS